jgi:5-methylcytosine-specific restriction enzyme subunit McrC
MDVSARVIKSAPTSYLGRIPVRNLWLLMLYASDLFRMHGTGNVGLEDSPDELPDVLAEMLARAVEIRQQRRLSSGYQRREAALCRVRGRIDVLSTERRQLLSQGRVACSFDELTIDTPRNRFVRAALDAISRIVQHDGLAHRCRKLASEMKMMGVSGNPPTRVQISADRFGRHDHEDRFMVAAAKLAFDLVLPTEASGKEVLALPDREERWVRRLYERAVGGFFDVVLSPKGWRVRCGTTLSWQIERRTSGIDEVLPVMRTDVVLDHCTSGRRIVVDTKFNSILIDGWYRDETLRSGYLYQIYSYLRSQADCGEPLADCAEGLLLHPSFGRKVDEAVVIQGHCIRFATVDLIASTQEIRSRLLRICEPLLPSR